MLRTSILRAQFLGLFVSSEVSPCLHCVVLVVWLQVALLVFTRTAKGRPCRPLTDMLPGRLVTTVVVVKWLVTCGLSRQMLLLLVEQFNRQM